MTSRLTKLNEDFHLAGRHIIVTGGSRGLGLAVAEAIVASGGMVSIVARNEGRAEAAAKSIRDGGGAAHAIPADMANTAGLTELADEIWSIAPVDGVVHAAGLQLRKAALDITVEEFHQIQTVNLYAPYFLGTAVARRQISEGRTGSQVFIGSLNSTIALPNISPYVVSKTALIGLARAFSREWSQYGLRSNVIAPGYFETEMTKDLLADDEARDRILGRIPMGKLGDVVGIGKAAQFLLSDASSYITGDLINVDGGWLSS